MMTYSKIQSYLTKGNKCNAATLINNADEINASLMMGVFSVGFLLNAKNEWKLLLEKGILGLIGFPLVILMEGAAFAFSIYQLQSAKNKNIARLNKIIAKGVKFTLVSLAIGLGVISKAMGLIIAPYIVPFLFSLSMAIMIAFSLSSLSRALIKMSLLPKYTDVYQRNKLQAFHSLAHSAVGIILLASIIVLMILPLFIPMAPIIIPAIAGISSLLCLFSFGVGVLRFTKNKFNTRPLGSKVRQSHKINHDNRAVFSKNKTEYINSDYFFRKNRINVIKNDTSNAKTYLLSEIEDKESKLKAQIDLKQTGLARYIDNLQSKKRSEKIQALQFVKKIINNPESLPTREMTSTGNVKEYYWNLNNGKTSAFQSMFREVGDVEDIFDAVNYHLLDRQLCLSP